MIRPGLCLLSAAAALAACGAPPTLPTPQSPPPQKPQPSAPAAAVAGPDLTSGPWGDYHSDRYNLRLRLPDAKRWRIEDERSPWLEATHAAASSTLLVRVWRTSDLASRATCEAQARLWRDLPERARAEMIDERRIDVPRGFDTRVAIGVLPATRGAPLTGFAMAFGGWARRCFAYVLTTTAAGKDAEELVGARLAAMLEVSLSNVTLESEHLPAVPREPLP